MFYTLCACVMLWAMLPEINAMMMMMIGQEKMLKRAKKSKRISFLKLSGIIVLQNKKCISPIPAAKHRTHKEVK